MKAWLEKIKGLFIALGIVYVLLALFLIPSYAKAEADSINEDGRNNFYIHIK